MLKHALRKNFTIMSGGDHRPRALAEHRAVLDAIAARDADAVLAATTVLLTHSLGDVTRIRDSGIVADPVPPRLSRSRPRQGRATPARGAAAAPSD
jgi:hypothetical protein